MVKIIRQDKSLLSVGLDIPEINIKKTLETCGARLDQLKGIFENLLKL